MNDTWKVTAQGASAGLLLDKVHAKIHECMHAQLLTNLLLCMHTHTRARAHTHTHTNTETDTHKRTHRYSHTRAHTGVSFHGACWVSAGYICHGNAVASGRKRGEFHRARARARAHTHIHIHTGTCAVAIGLRTRDFFWKALCSMCWFRRAEAAVCCVWMWVCCVWMWVGQGEGSWGQTPMHKASCMHTGVHM